MAHNFNQVLDNLSFYQTTKEQKSSWLSKMWNSDNPSENSSFISSVSSTLSKKSIPGLNILNSAAERTSRLKNFFILLFVAGFLFVFAFSFLPVILLFPQKFALLFSLASLVMQVALSYLKNSFVEYLQALFSKENAIVSGVYFASMFFTLYAAGVLGSYLIVIVACAVQGFAILWYVFSMFPGGKTGFLSLFKYGMRLCPCKEGMLPI